MKLSKKCIDELAKKLFFACWSGLPMEKAMLERAWAVCPRIHNGFHDMARFVLTEFPTTPKAPRWPKSTAKPIKETRRQRASAMFCEHASEVPQSCPCADGCYCKMHTCKPKACRVVRGKQVCR